MIPCDLCGLWLRHHAEAHPYTPDLSHVRGIIEHAATLARENQLEALETIRAALAEHDRDALTLNPEGEDA